MSEMASLESYQGTVVSKSHNAGFVALSCLVSFIGAASTLELINRRTGLRGWFNNLLLISSAISMGGVGIWSMHFVANRAVELGSGDPSLQISYSVGFTVLSFFVPIAVLLAAFIAIGSNERLSWWRIMTGGLFCGGAVCGMHYLGNASISNFRCYYNNANVAGSAVLAVAASTAALAMFFVFRAAWANSWWKRLISAVILAGSVCGMHWCAALGTTYMLISPTAEGSESSRNAPVIAVICLSIGACILMAGSAVLKARSMSNSARKAEQITLAAAIFDKQGRVLVDTNGLVPSMVITNSFLAKNNQEGFSVRHPLFHWMLQASRNWASIWNLIAGMKAHLQQVSKPRSSTDNTTGIELVSDHGELVSYYDLIFRELFCIAASALMELLGEQPLSAGVLWDDILCTGVRHHQTNVQLFDASEHTQPRDIEPRKENRPPFVTGGPNRPDCVESGRGSLMFLVRRLHTDRDVNRLVSAGYRFAEVSQVSGIIRDRMQIQSSEFDLRLREMATYADQSALSQPPVCLGLFGIKPRVDKTGFDVLVQKQARHLLPSTNFHLDSLEPWQLDLLRQFEGSSVVNVLEALLPLASSGVTTRECAFATQFSAALRDLRAGIRDSSFDQAIVSTTPLSVPFLDQNGVETTTTLVAFRLLIPVHCVINSPSCELVPLNLFKALQSSQKQQLCFTQSLYKDFAPISSGITKGSDPRRGAGRPRWSNLLRSSSTNVKLAEASSHDSGLLPASSQRTSSSCNSVRTCSTSDSCKKEDLPSSKSHVDEHVVCPNFFDRILVSQEITIHSGVNESLNPEAPGTSSRFGRAAHSVVERAKVGIGLQKEQPKDIEMGSVDDDSGDNDARRGHAQITGGRDVDLVHSQTFVDILFTQCIAGRDNRLSL